MTVHNYAFAVAVAAVAMARQRKKVCDDEAEANACDRAYYEAADNDDDAAAEMAMERAQFLRACVRLAK
jgi:hypothetical protein